MTQQTPDPTGVEQTYPAAAAPAPADATTSPAPAPADTSSTSSTPAPAPADATTSSTPDASSTPSSTSSGPKVGDLCTYTTEDEAGFETLTTCVVFEVFTEPDEDGKDVQLARVGVLPDERIVHADRLHTRS